MQTHSSPIESGSGASINFHVQMESVNSTRGMEICRKVPLVIHGVPIRAAFPPPFWDGHTHTGGP